MIPSFSYLDRYRNEGTRIYSAHAGYTEAEERYRPASETTAFPLPFFEVPLEEVNLYVAKPAPGLLDRYVPGSRVLFCIHPQLLGTSRADVYLEKVQSHRRARKGVLVAPSSSTRTLNVLEAHPPHALKVHFPFRVSRYSRRMRDEVVEQAIRVSEELQAGIGSMGRDFAFLREVLGVTFKNLDVNTTRGENWGYLVRETDPFPEPPKKGSLVPGFALYGRDYFDPAAPPLLFQIMGTEDPRTYVLEQIMFPIIRHWVRCFLNFGLLLEPHGQNVVLEVGEGGTVDRVVYRDLNLGIDTRRRGDLGIGVDASNTYNQMKSGEFNSITYDKFMGGHFFEFLAATVAERKPGLKPEDLRGPCREEFARIFPEHTRYLPRTVQYFSENRDQFGKPLFTDTGQSPAWRP